MFVLSIVAWYLLRAPRRGVRQTQLRHRRRGLRLCLVCSVIVLGDESGYTVGEAQQTKLAAMEAMWETEPAPAAFNLMAIPNEAEMKNDFAIEIPWVMGLIGTRSAGQADPGIPRSGEEPQSASCPGIEAVRPSTRCANPDDSAAKSASRKHKADLGFGLLLKNT